MKPRRRKPSSSARALYGAVAPAPVGAGHLIAPAMSAHTPAALAAALQGVLDARGPSDLAGEHRHAQP